MRKREAHGIVEHAVDREHHHGSKRSLGFQLTLRCIISIVAICIVVAFGTSTFDWKNFRGSASLDGQGKPLLFCRKLTRQSFHTCLSKHKVALIEIYHPNCGHCKTVLSQYEKAAAELRLKLFSIDSSKETELISDLGVDNEASLIIHREGKAPVIYSGKRMSSPIIKYIKRLAKASNLELPKQMNVMLEGKLHHSASDASHPASNAFDNNVATTWVSKGKFPASLTITFEEPKLFLAYSLGGPHIGTGDSYLQPLSWTLSGSKKSSGGDWHQLDRQSPGCIPGNEVSLCLDTETTDMYVRYKIQFDANAGKRTGHSQNSVGLSDWNLHNGECTQSALGVDEQCPPLPDQTDYHEPKPYLGRQSEFACYVVGGFDDARAEVIMGLLIAADAQKSEYLIDDVAPGVLSVYNLPETRNAMEDIMHSHGYDIRIEYGHPNSICNSDSRAVCERKVPKCRPHHEDGLCSLEGESNLMSQIAFPFENPVSNTAVCYGAYSFDYFKTPVFSSSSLVSKLNRAFIMNAKILQVAEEGKKLFQSKHFACIVYDTTPCIKSHGSSKEGENSRKKCIRDGIKSKMAGSTLWPMLLGDLQSVKSSVGIEGSKKLTVFIHGQHHLVPTAPPHGKTDNIWKQMKRGPPKVKPKKMDRKKWKNMAINSAPADSTPKKPFKNEPRTAEFMKNVQKAFVDNGLGESKFDTRTMEDVVWVRAGSDFRNDIAQRREDEMRGAVAWQICSSANYLWMDAASPFSQTLGEYACGTLNEKEKNAGYRHRHLQCQFGYENAEDSGKWIRAKLMPQ